MANEQATGHEAEKYRGFILDPFFHPPYWQVHIRATKPGQTLPSEESMPLAETHAEATANAKQRISAWLKERGHGIAADK